MLACNCRFLQGKPYCRSELLGRVRQALNDRQHQSKVRRTPSHYGAVEA